MSRKNANTAPAVVATAVVATGTAGNTESNKLPKSTKFEQLARHHEMLPRTESGEVIVTCEQFRVLCAGQKYLLNCKCSGKKTHIHIVEKISNYGSGAKTVFTGTANGEVFTELDILQLKTFVGCEYRSETADKTFIGRAVRELAKLEKEAREEEEKELADLIQKAKVLAQALKAKREEEAKKKAEERKKAEKAERDFEKVKALIAGLTPEQKKALGL